MANLDLAAPSTAILHTRRFSWPFAGLRAQLQPVAEIVPKTQPSPNHGPHSDRTSIVSSTSTLDYQQFEWEYQIRSPFSILEWFS
jgi:hypothetical protein